MEMALAVDDRMVADIFSDARRAGLPRSAEAEPVRGNGFVDPKPLGPQPGSKIIDRLMDAQDAEDRAKRRREADDLKRWR
jgi:hypothetical protein